MKHDHRHPQKENAVFGFCRVGTYAQLGGQNQTQKKPVIAVYSRSSAWNENANFNTCAHQTASCLIEFAVGEALEKYTFKCYADKDSLVSGPRPAFDLMMQDLKKGGTYAVVARSLDRITHNYLTAAAFRSALIKLGVGFGTVEQGTIINPERLVKFRRTLKKLAKRELSPRAIPQTRSRRAGGSTK